MGKIDNGLPTHAIFGTSSVANFMRQVQATVDAKISSINGTPAPRHSITSHSLSSFDSTESRVYPEYVLPPRRTADRLLDTYWTKVHNLYPFIHRQSFIRSYQRLWTGDQPESDSPTFPCLLNIVFALASQLSEDSSPAKREALSNEYYKIAKRTLQPVLLDGSSFETIQILLLMAQYLQSTNSRDRCWIVVGLAIRLAQSLGLHFPETSANLPRQVDREMARRVWHGCVMMDRILSMTFGRPLTISRAIASAVPLPAPIDDEYLLESAETFGEQRAGMPSQIEFFIQTVKLYGMLDDILLSLYSPNSDSATLYGKLQCWDNNSIFRVEAGLSRWKKEIPSCLQFNGQNEVSKLGSVFHRQSNVLQARYLHLRILLFRPVFTFFQDRDTTWAELFSDAFLQYSVAQQCVVQCIKAAQQLVELIHSNLQQDGSMGPLPAWWYNVFYIYTAATVMTATRLYPSVATDIDESLLTQSWNCALETLRAYQEYSRSAKRCLVTLEVLHEKVVGGIQAQNEEATEPTKSSRLDPWLDVNSTQQLRPNDAPEIQDLGDLGTTFDIMDMAWLDSTPFDLESYSWNTY
ncbi:fungal-specific transcription factor domain-containing protein [Talaromyces proteolyticus]|uniref:Fungal-specific transcription factor domain-containing protein n=1 Tax=Talaromyces proteolyticus TaxID=1131652 RepID=A0AAD4PY65_9EURO|nr:fungal-specific transcription factor domain-containing protein [Talaromyces proteolyticus]KAH8700820.1 fungal-specific transcription factor domain-containing protein [Talaromyces proteolyticus]